MNSIPSPLLVGLKEFLTRKFYSSVNIIGFNAIGGGCINCCGRLQTSAGTFFLKWNDAQQYPDMLTAEAKGLQLLSSGKISIPEVMGVGESGGYQFMLLEFIHQQPRNKKYWENFGEQLAMLHRTSATAFGLDNDNYIGSLKQFNAQHVSWVDFFIHQRLDIQVDLAVRAQHFNSSIQKKFDTLYQKLSDLLPVERPSLIHGDLWSGNLITNSTGEPCLIDPAVYFGHREADLAMTQLFGGFDDRFLDSYHETFPLTHGFDDRASLYNLYPLLVHLNLFGGGYVQQVNSILAYFTN